MEMYTAEKNKYPIDESSNLKILMHFKGLSIRK